MSALDNELWDLTLFSDTTRAERPVIGRQLTRLSIPAGKVLVRQGAVGDEFMIIVEGTADVSRDDTVIATLGRGDLVGEMALMHRSGRGRRTATVTARTDMVIYVGTPYEFRQLLSAAPSVAEKVHQTVAQRELRPAA
jgi:CRP/FNR family cyclic AMP-dependent transcriptional regulator